MLGGKTGAPIRWARGDGPSGSTGCRKPSRQSIGLGIATSVAACRNGEALVGKGAAIFKIWDKAKDHRHHCLWLPFGFEAHHPRTMGRHSDPTRPTLLQMREAAPWLWVWCCNVHCRHKAPMALAPLIIRWGGDASSDLLRRSARCSRCGNRGADLQHPSATSSDIGLAFQARAQDWSS